MYVCRQFYELNSFGGVHNLFRTNPALMVTPEITVSQDGAMLAQIQELLQVPVMIPDLKEFPLLVQLVCNMSVYISDYAEKRNKNGS